MTIKVSKWGVLDPIRKYLRKLASAEAGAKLARSNCQLGSRPFSHLRRVSKRVSVMSIRIIRRVKIHESLSPSRRPLRPSFL